MELNQYFKSIVEQDDCQIVICDLDHTIIYMNPKAMKDYEKRGGSSLIGRSLLECHNPESREKIKKVIEWFLKDKSHNIVHESYSDKKNRDAYIIALRDESGELIGYYEKHEFRTRDESPFYEMN